MSKSRIQLPIKSKIFTRVHKGKLQLVRGKFHYNPNSGKIIIKDDKGNEKRLDYNLHTVLYSIAEQPRPENYNYFVEFIERYLGSILKFQFITKEARKLDKKELLNLSKEFLDKVIKTNRLEITFNQIKKFIDKKVPDNQKRYAEYEIKKILKEDIEKSKKIFSSFIDKPDEYIAKRNINKSEFNFLFGSKKIKNILYGSIRAKGNGEGYTFFRDEGRVKSNHPFMLNLIETLKYIHNPEIMNRFTKRLAPKFYRFNARILIGKNRYKESLADALSKNPDDPVVFINLPKTIYKVGEKDFTDYLVEGFTKYLRNYDRNEKGFRNRRHIAITSDQYSDGKAFEAKSMNKFTRTDNIKEIFGKWKEMEELGLLKADYLKANIPKNAIVILLDDITTTGASVQSFVDYLGETLGREDNEGIYSVVLHNNNYKKQIEDEIKRQFNIKSERKKRKKR